MDALIRPATAADLDPAWELYYLDSVRTMNPAPRRSNPVPLIHLLKTGLLFVAEQDGRVVGFSGGLVRSGALYVAFLFIDPAYQGEAIGRQLLRTLTEHADAPHKQIVAADNNRAVSLYITEGFAPRTQLMWCEGPSERLLQLPDVGIELVEVSETDEELHEWDQRIAGVERPQEFPHWAHEENGRFFLAKRDGETVGYGCVRIDSPTLFKEKDFKGLAALGPVGAQSDAIAEVTTAFVRWAAQQRPKVSATLFATHESLPELLRHGLRIDYLTTYLSSEELFDTRLYLPSDEEL